MDPLKSEHSSIPFLKNLFSRCNPNGFIQIGFPQKKESLPVSEIDSFLSLLEGHPNEEAFFGVSMVDGAWETAAIGIMVSLGDSDKKTILEKIEGLLLRPSFCVDAGNFVYCSWKLKKPVTGEFPGVSSLKEKVHALFGESGRLRVVGRIPGTGGARVIPEYSLPDAEYSLEDLDKGFLLKRSSPPEGGNGVSPPAPAALPEGTGGGQAGGQEENEEGQGPGREAGPGRKDLPRETSPESLAQSPKGGWIKLWRKVQQHPFYKERRVFSRFEAWLDLLFMANHQNHEFPLGGPQWRPNAGR